MVLAYADMLFLTNFGRESGHFLESVETLVSGKSEWSFGEIVAK